MIYKRLGKLLFSPVAGQSSAADRFKEIDTDSAFSHPPSARPPTRTETSERNLACLAPTSRETKPFLSLSLSGALIDCPLSCVCQTDNGYIDASELCTALTKMGVSGVTENIAKNVLIKAGERMRTAQLDGLVFRAVRRA